MQCNIEESSTQSIAWFLVSTLFYLSDSIGSSDRITVNPIRSDRGYRMKKLDPIRSDPNPIRYNPIWSDPMPPLLPDYLATASCLHFCIHTECCCVIPTPNGIFIIMHFKLRKLWRFPSMYMKSRSIWVPRLSLFVVNSSSLILNSKSRHWAPGWRKIFVVTQLALTLQQTTSIAIMIIIIFLICSCVGGGEEWKSEKPRTECVEPLGMESGKIPESRITASSSFDVKSVGPQNARFVKLFSSSSPSRLITHGLFSSSRTQGTKS